MKKLKFQARDFYRWNVEGDSEAVLISSPLAKLFAKRVQEMFNDWYKDNIEDAPSVIGWGVEQEEWYGGDQPHSYFKKPTHTAKLVVYRR